ncbi:MAG: VOC family protein [Nakamurella sp.]
MADPARPVGPRPATTFATPTPSTDPSDSSVDQSNTTLEEAMAPTFEHIVFDAANALTLAQFWATLLDREIDPEASPYFATIGRTGPATGQPVFMFIQVPEPKAGKNRLHVDLASADRATDIERAIAAGGTHIGDFDEYGTQWSTLADVEGNLFDIASAHAPK